MIKLEAWSSILSLFQKFNKFNNTGTQMLDSIYNHMTQKLKSHFKSENIKVLPLLGNVVLDLITLH